ncbi:MAG: sulfite exporter TauE/SafE family protein [Desulfobacteraceae bacterium]|nr:sulfite exporter TauE/SafE family protein [Desulfobacteraceae bacterium]
MTEFGLAFLAGLAGSGHCLGMCGGILAALAVANPEVSTGQRFRLNLSYHIGRIITYTLLGLLAGAVAQVALFTALKPHLFWLFAAANLMVIAIGVATALGLRRLSLAALDGTGWGFLYRALDRASCRATPPAFLVTGLVMGLLPCGLVYGVLIAAATAGSLLRGGGMMLAFGLGTLPALLSFGQAATALGASATTLFLRVMGVAVALLGLLGFFKALVTLGVVAPLTFW